MKDALQIGHKYASFMQQEIEYSFSVAVRGWSAVLVMII